MSNVWYVNAFIAKSRIDEWKKGNRLAVSRCQQVLSDLKAGGGGDFAMMSVVMREIRSLRRIETG